MTIQNMQEMVDLWIQKYGVRYFDVMTNLALLMEEVGEFARITARVYGEQSFKESTTPPDTKEALADEIADIMFVLTCLANQMHIDLNRAMMRNLEKKTSRDKNRHGQNPKLQ
jgi:NTP pyrophosphatase (non-canonical NTP hydrolase)